MSELRECAQLDGKTACSEPPSSTGSDLRPSFADRLARKVAQADGEFLSCVPFPPLTGVGALRGEAMVFEATTLGFHLWDGTAAPCGCGGLGDPCVWTEPTLEVGLTRVVEMLRERLSEASCGPAPT